ncbi:hypothetical protein F8271_14885 [Micromonospora sp. ALFpr18c]|nr:hypothetical protein [Micromonospora sp. ALFpr18c]KAB1941075.1 hypothetical protein F8271_14885 [Micromonospora sp. ALFpr18c]
MVSFFLSYRADDGGFVARSIAGALRDRFGKHRVTSNCRSFVGNPGLSAAIRKRLAGTTALIVVIGPRWRDGVDGLLGPLSTSLRLSECR